MNDEIQVMTVAILMWMLVYLPIGVVAAIAGGACFEHAVERGEWFGKVVAGALFAVCVACFAPIVYWLYLGWRFVMVSLGTIT